MSEQQRTYIVDTHPLIWHLEGNPRLSPMAKQILRDRNARIVVPTLVAIEPAFVSARKRTTVTLAEALEYIDVAPNCALWPLDREVIESTPITLNIHDGIIVGTAIMCRDVLGEHAVLITKDKEIAESGLVEVVW